MATEEYKVTHNENEQEFCIEMSGEIFYIQHRFLSNYIKFKYHVYIECFKSV